MVYVVLFFGASIFVHEWGHYLAARWRGLKIDRFSIGFGPRLFGWSDKRGVDWRISLFPLGGYVALPQLADMRGIEGEYSDSGPQLPPLSYADKMIVSVAGAFFNVLFALVIGCVLWKTGLPVTEEYESTTIGYVAPVMTDDDGMERDGPGLRAGLLPGDEIVRIDGNKVRNWEDILYGVMTGVGRSSSGNPQTDMQVLRGEEEIAITVYPILDEHEGIRRIGLLPTNSVIVGETMDNSPARLAGLQSGDVISEANGIRLFRREALSNIIYGNPENPVLLTVIRDNRSIQVEIQPEMVVYNKKGDTAPMLGIRWKLVRKTRYISPIKQVEDAVRTTFRVLGALVHPKSDVGIKNLSGPVGISYTLYVLSQISILEVLSIVVLINVNLAILNLLPIPVLDGGHMAFATIAKISGKPIPIRVVAASQGTFMLLFLAIFVYVTFFDAGRVKRNESAITDRERIEEMRVPIQFKGNTPAETTTTEESNPQS
jgi:regulator of sigma E protease